MKSLNIFTTEKQVIRWIHEIEEEEPTGFIVYEKFEALVLDASKILWIPIKSKIVGFDRPSVCPQRRQ